MERVITHQNSLIQEFKEKNRDGHKNSIEQRKTLVCDKMSPYFLLKNVSINNE